MEIIFEKKEIVVKKAFLQKASVFGSEEYKTLQKALSDLPGFEVKRRTVRCRRYSYRVA